MTQNLQRIRVSACSHGCETPCPNAMKLSESRGDSTKLKIRRLFGLIAVAALIGLVPEAAAADGLRDRILHARPARRSRSRQARTSSVTCSCPQVSA